MKTILAIMMFASLSEAQTYECAFKNSDTSFQIVENSPNPGQATISRSGSNPIVLSFSKTETHSSTRFGSVISTNKVYFHPYYEYRIDDTIYVHKPEWNGKDINGTFISEMNPAQTFACVEKRNQNE